MIVKTHLLVLENVALDNGEGREQLPVVVEPVVLELLHRHPLLRRDVSAKTNAIGAFGYSGRAHGDAS